MANDNTMLWVLGGGIAAYFLLNLKLPSLDGAGGGGGSSAGVAPSTGGTIVQSTVPVGTQTSGIMSTTPVSPSPVVKLPTLQMCPGGGSPPCSSPILGNGGQPINLPINIAASPYFGGGPTYAPGSVDCAPPNYMSGGICYPPLIRDPRFEGGPVVTLAGLGLGRLGRAPIRWSEANGIPIRRGR